MSESALVPHIHNIVTSPAERYLQGLEITDAEPFARALTACGVPEDEMSDWHIYTGRPADMVDKAVIIDPAVVDEIIVKSAGKVDAGFRWRYVQQMNEKLPEIATMTCAVGVIEYQARIQGKDYWDSYRYGKKLVLAASVISEVATFNLGDRVDSILPLFGMYGFFMLGMLTSSRMPSRKTEITKKMVTKEVVMAAEGLATAIRPHYHQ